MRQHRLDLRVQRQLRLGRLHRVAQLAGREPRAQALDRVVALQAYIRLARMVFGAHAAHAQVGQVMQHRRRQRDVEPGRIGRGGTQLPLQVVDAVVLRVETLLRRLAQHPQRGGGGRRRPRGRILARGVEPVEPAPFVVGTGRRRRLGMDGRGDGLGEG